MRYKVSDIVHENQKAWVLRDKKNECYTVFRVGLTHSTSDSSYELNDDGLGIAKARADYFNKSAPLHTNPKVEA